MKKVYFHTLGCKVNQYDTQAMAEIFLKNGYELCYDLNQANVCIVNTCTVTSTADKKSMQMINRIKKQNPNAHLIITGCMSQGADKDLLKTGATLVIGTQFRHMVVELLEEAIKENKPKMAVASLENASFESLSVKSHSEHTRAVIKIQEGCDFNCSYCIIPSVRGHIRSRDIASIEKECIDLANAGYKEIVLTGINMSCYGKDLNDGYELSDVVAVINRIDGIKRIRISSLEPGLITEKNAKRLSESEKLCNHFHLALQSGSDKILRLMQRRYTTARFKKSADLLKKYFKDCMLTTDIIVGFPQESEEDFQDSLKFIDSIDFLKVHAFPYSPRKDTKAANMSGQIDNSIKKERNRRLIALAKTKSQEILKSCIGKEYEVLVEEYDGKEYYKGYSSNYIPVLIKGNCIKGEIVKVIAETIKGDQLICNLKENKYGKLYLL